MKRLGFLWLCLLSLLAACSFSSPNNPASQQVTLTVSAAASMQDAIKAAGQFYQQEHQNTDVSYNFASSGTLQQQIEQGAPVDVFVSADQQQMNALQTQSLLLGGTRKALLKNQVVLIAPKNTNAADISNFEDLTNSKVERFSIGNPQFVPAGRYGKEVLNSLHLYQELKPKTVFAQDVRQVLSYVETGNVDAGIVYATDASISNQVIVVATAPQDSHSPIIYPVAVIKDSKMPEAAREFVQFLSSDKASAIFEKYDFIPATQ